MELSIFFAQFLAIMYLSFTVGYVLNTDYYQKTFPQMLDDGPFRYISGFLSLLFGMVLVNYHNTWTADWTTIITVIGWMALIKGVALIAFPNVVNIFKPMVKAKNMKVMILFTLILGLVFGYLGFIV